MRWKFRKGPWPRGCGARVWIFAIAYARSRSYRTRRWARERAAAFARAARERARRVAAERGALVLGFGEHAGENVGGARSCRRGDDDERGGSFARQSEHREVAGGDDL